MSQTYFTILTNLGAALIAQAAASETQLKLTHLAVGDGNGNVPTPSPTQTHLIHEVRRSAINTIYTDEDNKNHIIIEQVIPPEEGGFYIRELGVFDANGNLIATGNCPPSYKPKLSEGSGRTQVINMVIMVDNTGTVELKIDASTVLATRKYVNDLISSKMTDHEKSRNHPDASTTEKGFVQLNSAVNSAVENQAATPKAVKITYDLANSANNKANNKVPNTRKINNKQLNADIILSADDVGAISVTGGEFKGAVTGTDITVKTSLTIGNAKGTYSSSGLNVDKDLLINNTPVLKQGDVGLSAAPTYVQDIASSSVKTGFHKFNPTYNTNAPNSKMYGMYQKILWNNGEAGGVINAYELHTNNAFIGYVNKTSEDIIYAQYITTANIGNYLPVGIPQPWPQPTPPSGWIVCDGRKIDKDKYPKLAQIYTNGYLPDLRGEFIRGLDSGRQVDVGREILSTQGDATRNITGRLGRLSGLNWFDDGAMWVSNPNNARIQGGHGSADYVDLNFDSSRIVPTANENRPRNVAFLYIVKAE